MIEGINPADPAVRARLFQLRGIVATQIESNPVYHQYEQHINRQHHETNDKPWHAIGEKLYATWLVLHASMRENKIEVIGVKDNEDRETAVISLGCMIYLATPYLWSDAMERLADASPLPKHTISPNVMPMPTMFWSRETAYLSKEGDNNWLTVFKSENRLCIAGDLSDDVHKKLRIITTTIPFGKIWPDDFGGDPDIGRVLKRCAFLNSPYIAGDIHRLPRHQRRQMEREGLPSEKVQETIHVVTLRHQVVKAQPAPTAAEAVEWKHHWWVQGFYRAQWYPSEKAHKVIWIAPFLKGDLNKPLLEKVYTVVR